MYDKYKSSSTGDREFTEEMGLLLGVEDKGHFRIEHRLTNLLFFSVCFPSSFVLLSSVVLYQLCLLHQVGARTGDDWRCWFLYKDSSLNVCALEV